MNMLNYIHSIPNVFQKLFSSQLKNISVNTEEHLKQSLKIQIKIMVLSISEPAH